MTMNMRVRGMGCEVWGVNRCVGEGVGGSGSALGLGGVGMGWGAGMLDVGVWGGGCCRGVKGMWGLERRKKGQLVVVPYPFRSNVLF